MRAPTAQVFRARIDAAWLGALLIPSGAIPEEIALRAIAERLGSASQIFGIRIQSPFQSGGLLRAELAVDVEWGDSLISECRSARKG